MKLKELIRLLGKLEDEYKNHDVIVDFDENGWYDLEKVRIVVDPESEKCFINLQSSNEA